MSTLQGLRDDVYRRPLATALERLGIGPGWRCVDVGAGGGRRLGGPGRGGGPHRAGLRGRQRPAGPGRGGRAAAAHSQVLAITQAGEDLVLPEPVDLAFCRFLLLHVIDPAVVLGRMAGAVRPGGWVVAQEPITSAGRVGGMPLSMPDARHPDVGALLPALVRDAGPRDRRRLGRGAGRRRPRAGGQLPGLADRRRPRRRPGRPAAAGHRRWAAKIDLRVGSRSMATVARPGPGRRRRCGRRPGRGRDPAATPDAGRRPAASTPIRSSPTTWPTPPPPRPPPGPRSTTAPRATLEARHRLRLRGRRPGRPGGQAGRAGGAVGGGTRPRCPRPATSCAPTGTRRRWPPSAASRAPVTWTTTSSWSARPSTASPRTRSDPTPSTSTGPTATFPRSIIAGLAELGGFGLSVPEAYGGFATGGESDYLGMVVATEELSWGSLGIGGSLITRPEILTRALVHGGTEEQKQALAAQAGHRRGAGRGGGDRTRLRIRRGQHHHGGRRPPRAAG